MRFTNKDLKNMIIPLFLEQLLVMQVGIADTLVSGGVVIVSQCMGADDTDEAEYYFKKLMKITVAASVAWNVIIFAATPLMLMAYDLSAETKGLVIWLVVIHNVFNALAYPFSGALSAGLRAAGDVKFTMIVTVISTIGIRLLLSVLFGIVLDMGGLALRLPCAPTGFLRPHFLRTGSAGVNGNNSKSYNYMTEAKEEKKTG